jgi:hypothetical protein
VTQYNVRESSPLGVSGKGFFFFFFFLFLGYICSTVGLHVDTSE